MRLWHYKLIPFLDRQHLLSQHRECCALRGNGWGKKHATVDYAFKHSPLMLCAYHNEVMDEMKRRGYYVDEAWRNVNYRGKGCKPYEFDANDVKRMQDACSEHGAYPEHDDAYLKLCIDLLERKGCDVSLMRYKLLYE